MASAESLDVEVAYSPQPGSVQRKRLSLNAGACVRDALQASGLFSGVDFSGLALGVWGKPRGLDDLVRNRDRIEVYRPLRVDPKEARRQRYRAHLAQAGR